MKNIIFGHLKEDINQTMAIDLDVFEDARKQLEEFSLDFLSCNSFPSMPFTSTKAC